MAPPRNQTIDTNKYAMYTYNAKLSTIFHFSILILIGEFDGLNLITYVSDLEVSLTFAN